MKSRARVFLFVLLCGTASCALTGPAPLLSPHGGSRGEVTKAKAPSAKETSLIAKITADTPPRRAASLRLTEEGSQLLDAGEYAKALTRLEQTLSMDSSNPYVYFYLAMAHFRLAHYRQSMDFLDVAESYLSSQPYWLGEVHSLRGENYQALGLLDRANSSYVTALRFDPTNRQAALGLSQVRKELKTPLAH